MTQTHKQLAAAQFGPRAQAYVASTVHSAGADLDWLAERVREKNIDALLDVGCGGGHVSYRLAPHTRTVTACDPSEEMTEIVLATATERNITNIRTVLAGAESLPFEDESFDAAVTRFSAHHWDNLAKGLFEINRVLKRGGLLYIIDVLTPASPLLDTHLQAIEVLRDPSHVRDYSIAEWAVTLGTTNFGIEALQTERIYIDFSLWGQRMNTPETAITAIRNLMHQAPSEVKHHFDMDHDGNFRLDTIWISAHKV